jgi:hypothetical protein
MASRNTQLRAEQTYRRKQEAVRLEADNARRIFLLKEQHGVGVVLALEERLDVLFEVLNIDRVVLDLAWEKYVARKLDKAEEEVAAYVELHARAKREAELLEGVPLDGQQTAGGLTIVGGT